jgi:hypothetical protein
MNRAPADLSLKLDFALKQANMSKGRLAADAHVDKSLVGRWARGLIVPSEHNLTVVTEILARKFPGFNLASWHWPMEAFAASLGGALAFDRPRPPAPAAAAAPAANFLARSFTESLATMTGERRSCLGIYLGFRHSLSMAGRLICDVYVVWREGEAVLFKQLGVAFGHAGPVCVLRSQVYLIGDDINVINGIFFALLIGVFGGRAVRMDGLIMTVAGGIRVNTPSATAIVLQRIADLPEGEGCPDAAVLDRLIQRVRLQVAASGFKTLLAPEILAAVAAPVGLEQADGTKEPVLRVATERSLSRSEIECDETTAHYAKRLREIFLAEDAALLPMAPLASAPGVGF